MQSEFAYSNLSGRPRGPLLKLAGVVLPGIARVHADVEPFAHAWQRSNAAALAAGGPLWVALGDSLTQGIGAPDPTRGWVGKVRDRLAAQGRELGVVNLGVSGATTVDVIERQLPVLATLDPSLVTLMVGSNDLMRPSLRRGLPERFEQILDALPSGSVVTTMPNPSSVAGQVNRTIARVAAERDLVVAEMRDPRTASWRGRLAADHFHPNEAGYAAIAEVVGDVLVGLGRG